MDAKAAMEIPIHHSWRLAEVAWVIKRQSYGPERSKIGVWAKPVLSRRADAREALWAVPKERTD